MTATRASGADVVLMDLDLPAMGGIEATRRLLEELPGAATRVLMLMTSESDEAVFGALRAGAPGSSSRTPSPKRWSRRYGW